MATTKAHYVDGFVLAVPKKKIAAYQKLAKEGEKMWRTFGALDYKECRLEDGKSSGGALTYKKLLKLKPTETAYFSFVTFKSRAHRDQVNKKVMAYFKEKYAGEEAHASMPFQMNRMAYGGFTVDVG